MAEELIEFNMEKAAPSIIMVAGVGGGGGNAVNYMYSQGIAEVAFMVCNTDRQHLSRSAVPIKVHLGENLTEGLGAGNDPEIGRAAALESLDEVVSVFKREGTKMVFVTAGMGGGTGTGAAPIIAKAAKELGILTVGIVTSPFKAEGARRMKHAMKGIEEMRANVDSLLIINNENINEMYGDLILSEAFGKADDILATAAKGIAEIITGNGIINVDFADVKAVMSNSGVALMGSGTAGGDGRAQTVADLALSSPLLNHNYIVGAKDILINITSGYDEIRLKEAESIINYIQERAGNNANIIWGAGHNADLGNEIKVTIIATGFDITSPVSTMPDQIEIAPIGEFDGEAAPEDATQDDAQPGDKEQGPFAARRFTRPDVQGAAPQENAEVPPQRAGYRPPLTPAPPRENVLKVQTESRYKDIDKVIDEPAYVRRRVKFIKETPEEGGKSAKVVLKEEQPQEKTPPSDNSLF